MLEKFKKNPYEICAGLLISLMPIALVIGPVASEIVVIFVSIGFLIKSYKKKIYDYYKNKFFYFFLIFWIN